MSGYESVVDMLDASNHPQAVSRVPSSTAGAEGGDPSVGTSSFYEYHRDLQWFHMIPISRLHGFARIAGGYRIFMDFLVRVWRRIHPTEVCKAFSEAAYITTQSIRHHAWDHQEMTRLRVAVLATQAGKSQVSMVLEMWFYADGGAAGVVTHDISAKDIASIFKHGWVARANVNRYRDQQHVGSLASHKLFWSGCLTAGMLMWPMGHVYTVSTPIFTIWHHWGKKNIHSPAMTTRVHSGWVWWDQPVWPGPRAKGQTLAVCQALPTRYKIYCRYMIQSQYIDMHAHITMGLVIYIHTILLNITELVLLFTICLPLCSHIFPVKSYMFIILRQPMFNVGECWRALIEKTCREVWLQILAITT